MNTRGGVLMFALSKVKSRFRYYRNECTTILVGAATIFLGLSLYSYHPKDASWFFYTSNTFAIHNYCGIVGANIAALLMYLLGLGSFLLVPTLFFIAYLYWHGKSFHDEWERYISAIMIIVLFSTLCTMHKWSLYSGIMPGGAVGFYSARLLYRFFDRIGTLIFLYTSLQVCLILLLRFSYIGMVEYFVKRLQFLLRLIKRHKVISKIGYGLKLIVLSCVRPIVLFAKFSYRILDGSLFDHYKVEPVTYNQEKRLRDISQEYTHPIASSKVEREEYISSIQSPSEQKREDIPESHEYDAPRSFSIAHSAQENSYGLPSLDIFIGVDGKQEDIMYKQELQDRAKILEEKLERFGVCGKVVSIKSGPVVTLFEYQPQIDTKLSRILALEDDLALALQALSIRIIAPIPGRSVVGFEVSNKDRKDVLLAPIVRSDEYQLFQGSLPLILGEDTIGNNVIVDLAKMPHLLVAGSTGSGKSVALNSMLISLLCKCSPEELKLILIDPKRLEFASYADIAHLLFPIVTDPRRTAPILKWVVQQMEQRYERMARYNSRNIFEYNKRIKEQGEIPLPFIVVIIDELSDLMLSVGREIEDLITRITQMARAAGIHMIVATQRPSVDVITGLIKVNFPSRISFRVTSKVDSRTILDCSGADKLLGRGDMLFLDSTASILNRVHGAFVSNREIDKVVNHIRTQKEVSYLDITEELSTNAVDISDEDGHLYEQVLEFIQEVDEISISLLQRKFRIGYNRSARIIDRLEGHGLIMPADGSKTRRVIRS